MGIREQQVGVFAATRWELNAVRRSISSEEDRRVAGARCVVGRRGRCRVFLFETGVGVERADTLSNAVLAVQPLDLAVASGFASALAGAGIGDLLIGTEVLLHRGPPGQPPDGPWARCSRELSAMAELAGRGVGLDVQVGRFVTVPRVLWRAAEKRDIAACTGAVGLDMESAAVCTAAHRHGVPVLVARTVSDRLDEDLPLDFNLFLGPSGWARGALACVTHPTSLIGLNRLRVQAAIAAERLTRFWGRFFDELGQSPSA